MQDLEGLRGIDHVTHQILAKVELQKVCKGRDNSATARISQWEGWECARLWMIYHGRTEARDVHLPTLHACCLARDLPVALEEQTLRQYGGTEATTLDANGNSPLHCAASLLPMEEMDDLLPRILRLNPSMAAIQNSQGEFPIDLAIRCGRRWQKGCGILLRAHPPAITARTPGQAKLLLTELLARQNYTMVYAVLRVKQEILI
jgi:hypothetical protein